MTFKPDKILLKTLLTLAVPIALQNLIVYSTNLMDTLMLGRVGEVQLSAAAMANQLFFVMMVLGFGIGSGSNVLISQYWGKGDRKAAKQVMSVALRTGLLVSLVFMALAVLAPAQVMRIFTPDPLAISEGAKYLRIMGCSMPFTMMASVMIMTLRPLGSVGISLYSSSVSLVVNVFLNWVLIFGKLGAPALGVTGAAIATLIARVIELLIVAVYLFRYEEKLTLRFDDLKTQDKAMVKDFVANCVPIMFNELLWSLGMSAVTAIIGQMSTGFMAANGIYASVNQIMMVAIFGLSNSGAVLVGKAIGSGQREKVGPIAAMLLSGALLWGLLMGTMLFFGRGFLLSFYTLTPETHRLAMGVMAVGSVVIIFQSLANASLIGVLRGGGDARFVLLVDTIFLWLVSIPLGALAGFYFKLPPPVVYCVLKADELLKVLFSITRILRGRWVRDVTR